MVVGSKFIEWLFILGTTSNVICSSHVLSQSTIAMISQDEEIAWRYPTQTHTHYVGSAVVPVGRMSYVTTLSAHKRSSRAPPATHEWALRIYGFVCTNPHQIDATGNGEKK